MRSNRKSCKLQPSRARLLITLCLCVLCKSVRIPTFLSQTSQRFIEQEKKSWKIHEASACDFMMRRCDSTVSSYGTEEICKWERVWQTFGTKDCLSRCGLTRCRKANKYMRAKSLFFLINEGNVRLSEVKLQVCVFWYEWLFLWQASCKTSLMPLNFFSMIHKSWVKSRSTEKSFCGVKTISRH